MNSKQINRAFKKLAKRKFPNPDSCTKLEQTRTNIFELATIIQHFEKKFEYIPESALLLFYKYNEKQESILFDKYKEEYLKP